MRYCITFFLCIHLSLAHGQAWKTYLDSAEIYNNERALDRAVEFYSKAILELENDTSEIEIYVKACNSIGNLYAESDQFELSQANYFKALIASEKWFGKELDYATTCSNLGNLYTNFANYQEAEALFIEAKNIRERILGNSHPDYATICNNLGILYWTIGNYPRAIELHITAKSIRESVLGHNCYDHAQSCNNLALVYVETNEYQKAELLYLQAKNITETIYGKEHQISTSISNNLAGLRSDMGKYEEAEKLYLDVKEIRQRILGTENSRYANICENLAVLYTDMGQYEKAEPLYIEALKIRAKLFGKIHPDYADATNNFGSYYYDLGYYDKAEILFVEAKSIRDTLFGKTHPDYAQSCNNLGALYFNKKEYDKAEVYFTEAKLINENFFGKENIHYANNCKNLANVYAIKGEYLPAQSLYLEAQSITEKILGKDNPRYAINCNDLGNLYWFMGMDHEAETFYLKCFEINKRILGQHHPANLSTLRNLAGIYWIEKQYQNALSYYKQAYEVKYTAIDSIFQFTSESEKDAFLKKGEILDDYFYSFCSSSWPLDKQELAYDVSISNRNLILSWAKQLRQAIYLHGNDHTINIYNKWIDFRKQISFWESKNKDAQPKYLHELYDSASIHEKELTSLTSGLTSTSSFDILTWQSIQKYLKQNEAAIEFVHFDYYNGKQYTDSTFYVALVIRHGTQPPVMVKLFEERQLAQLISTNHVNKSPDELNNVYTNPELLYSLIWSPLEAQLKDINRVYYSSTGYLQKLSLAAIPINQRILLGEKYQLVQLSTTANLIDTFQCYISSRNWLQLYGGIDYDSAVVSKDQMIDKPQIDTLHQLFPIDRDSRGSGFKYLPGTSIEVKDIGELASKVNISASILSDQSATEESIKNLTGASSPPVLHIATHGFYFPNPKETQEDEFFARFETSGRAFKQSDNPLFRSGLLFAGANHTWQGKYREGKDDGILTAYEVSNIYLPNTLLVVLSACESGLGDIHRNEGIYGLQRAFKIAGVKYILSSLWQVPDKETAEFMQLFYSNIFNHYSIDQAFYHTQTLLKDKYRNEPFKWAAWILIR